MTFQDNLKVMGRDLSYGHWPETSTDFVDTKDLMVETDNIYKKI